MVSQARTLFINQQQFKRVELDIEWYKERLMQDKNKTEEFRNYCFEKLEQLRAELQVTGIELLSEMVTGETHIMCSPRFYPSYKKARERLMDLYNKDNSMQE